MKRQVSSIIVHVFICAGHSAISGRSSRFATSIADARAEHISGTKEKKEEKKEQAPKKQQKNSKKDQPKEGKQPNR